jgi:hypothetical protein
VEEELVVEKEEVESEGEKEKEDVVVVEGRRRGGV